MIIAFCFQVCGCDTNCNRVKRTLGLLDDTSEHDALHVHIWNDMEQEEHFFPNVFNQVTTPMPQERSATISALQKLRELPQELYRKSDRDLYGKFYKLNPRNNKNARPMNANANYYPSIMNYAPNGYQTNIRMQPPVKIPPMVRQSLYGMFQNYNQPNYYTNLHKKKKPRLPTPIESDLIRIASGKIIANEPKPQKYHTFQLHEAMPGQKLLPPTRIPLFKPVPPPLQIVPILDDDFAMMRIRPHRHSFRPHKSFQPHPPQPSIFHPTTFQQPNNTHPYPFHTTDFNQHSMTYFKAHDAVTPASVQLTAPVTDAYTITSTTVASPAATTDPLTTGTTTGNSPTSSPHVTYSNPTYPNVVYAVPATTESSNATRPVRHRKKNNGQGEFRIVSINNKLQNGNLTRPTYNRRRPLRQKQKRPLQDTNGVAQLKPPLPDEQTDPTTTTEAPTTTTTTTTPPPTTTEQPQHAPNHRNGPYRINMRYGQKKTKTTAEPKQDVVYGRPIEALIVDPPNSTVEMNPSYSKRISNRNDQLQPTNAQDNELINLNRDIKRVLEVTLKPEAPTTTSKSDDDDDIHNDPLLMENLNKNEMLPIGAENIFDRNLLSETHTQQRAFVDTHTAASVNRRSDNAAAASADKGAADVNSNAIDAEKTKPMNEDKYYKWYSRYAADNQRKYGRAIISEHFKKVEIEPNVAWVILPR